eukprot:scaffold100613_cov63-Phaeocystis_antarctica.AAC.1
MSARRDQRPRASAEPIVRVVSRAFQSAGADSVGRATGRDFTTSLVFPSDGISWQTQNIVTCCMQSAFSSPRIICACASRVTIGSSTEETVGRIERSCGPGAHRQRS